VTQALVPFLKEPTSLPSFPPLPKPAPTGKLVAFLEPTPTEAGTEIATGVQDAANLVHWKTKVIQYAYSDPTAVGSALLSAVNDNPNEIIIPNVAPPQIRQGLAAAKAKGIIVVIVSPNGNFTGVSGVTAAEWSVQTPATASEWGLGPALAILADAAKSGTTAHIGVVSSADLASLFTLITAKFKSTIAQYCSKCSVDDVNVPLADIGSGNGGKDVVSFMQTHPDVNYLFIEAGLFDNGVRSALDQVGLSKVRIYGSVPGSAQLQELNHGGSSGWFYSDNALAGWVGVDTGLRAMTGANVTIHDNEVQPAWLIKAADNVGNTPPSDPALYASTFSKIWHVGS
jgi:ABC-type sugar transport system substrate-binding protein